MTNKYLEKVAIEKKKKSPPPRIVGGVILGAAGMHLANSTGAIAQFPLEKKVMGDIGKVKSDSGADLHTLRKFMRDNNLHKTTTFNTRSHVLKDSGIGKEHHNSFQRHKNGPGYLHSQSIGAKKNYIIGVKSGISGKVQNADILMHEAGHAKDYSKFGKFKTKSIGISKAPFTSKILPLAALTNDKTKDYAPALAAIPGALTLRSEAAANYHAYKGIKAHKGAAAANRFLTKFVPAQMGHYAVSAAAPVVGVYAAKKLLDKVYSKKKDTKK